MKNLKVCCKSCVHAMLGEYNNAYCNNPNRPEGIEPDILDAKNFCCSEYELDKNMLYKYLRSNFTNYPKCIECEHYYQGMCCLHFQIMGDNNTCPEGKKGLFSHKNCCVCKFYDGFGCSQQGYAVGAFSRCSLFKLDPEKQKDNAND